MKKSTSTKREYLEPKEFHEKYPGRRKLLANTLLEKYIGWVLMEQLPGSSKMAYFLMSAKSYSRACYDMRGASTTSGTDNCEANIEDKLATESESNVALTEQLDDLTRLHEIRNSIEYRNADMARDKKRLQVAIKEVQSLLEALRIANPHYVELVQRQLDDLVPTGLVDGQN